MQKVLFFELIMIVISIFSTAACKTHTTEVRHVGATGGTNAVSLPLAEMPIAPMGPETIIIPGAPSDGLPILGGTTGTAPEAIASMGGHLGPGHSCPVCHATERPASEQPSNSTAPAPEGPASPGNTDKTSQPPTNSKEELIKASATDFETWLASWSFPLDDGNHDSSNPNSYLEQLYKTQFLPSLDSKVTRSYAEFSDFNSDQKVRFLSAVIGRTNPELHSEPDNPWF